MGEEQRPASGTGTAPGQPRSAPRPTACLAPGWWPLQGWWPPPGLVAPSRAGGPSKAGGPLQCNGGCNGGAATYLGGGPATGVPPQPPGTAPGPLPPAPPRDYLGGAEATCARALKSHSSLLVLLLLHLEVSQHGRYLYRGGCPPHAASQMHFQSCSQPGAFPAPFARQERRGAARGCQRCLGTQQRDSDSRPAQPTDKYLTGVHLQTS